MLKQRESVEKQVDGTLTELLNPSKDIKDLKAFFPFF